MTDTEQRKAAKTFAEEWKDRGYKKGESQTFWLQLLSNVFEVPNVSQFIRFEDTVHIDKATGFNWKKMTESDCVAQLMNKYQELVKNE